MGVKQMCTGFVKKRSHFVLQLVSLQMLISCISKLISAAVKNISFSARNHDLCKSVLASKVAPFSDWR